MSKKLNIKDWLQKREPVEGLVPDFAHLLDVVEQLGGDRTAAAKYLLEKADPVAVRYSSERLPRGTPEQHLNEIYRLAASKQTELAKSCDAVAESLAESCVLSLQVVGNLESVSELIKGIPKVKFNKVKKGQNSIGASVVDPTIHMSQSTPGTQALTSAANQKKNIDIPYHPAQEEGISPKLVLDLKDHIKEPKPEMSTTVMIKPYHAESQSPGSWPHPIFGWAAQTTHNLYHAAGLGHLVENVGTQMHDGIPVTVHHFHKVMKEELPDMNPLHALQIAAMDYITDNNDRHGGNIALTPKNILAIDHERSFQYEHPFHAFRNAHVNRGANFSEHVHGTALAEIGVNCRSKHLEELAGWWKKNSGKIADEFKRNLEAITDPMIREHVRNNFARRVKWMNDWANSKAKNNRQLGWLMSNNDGPKNIRISAPSEAKIKKLAAAVPKDIVVAADRMHGLQKALLQSKVSDPIHKQVAVAAAVLKQRINEAHPEDLKRLLSHILSSPHYAKNPHPEVKELHPMYALVSRMRKDQDLAKELISYAQQSGHAKWAKLAKLMYLGAWRKVSVDPSAETLPIEEIA